MLISSAPISALPISASPNYIVVAALEEIPCPYIPERIAQEYATLLATEQGEEFIANPDALLMAYARPEDNSIEVSRRIDENEHQYSSGRVDECR